MKERFVERYKSAIRAYFERNDMGEGSRAKMYVMDEYQKILEEEFEMTHEETREIYDALYGEYYFQLFNTKEG